MFPLLLMSLCHVCDTMRFYWVINVFITLFMVGGCSFTKVSWLTNLILFMYQILLTDYNNFSGVTFVNVSFVTGTKNGMTLTVKLHHTTMAHITHLPWLCAHIWSAWNHLRNISCVFKEVTLTLLTECLTLYEKHGCRPPNITWLMLKN